MQRLDDGYRLTLSDGASLECDLAILADGGRSALREQLGIGVNVKPYGQSALIANVSPLEAHRGQAFERFTDDGPMALLPLSDNSCALVWTRASADAERLLAISAASFLGELQQAFGYRLGRCSDCSPRNESQRY